MHSKSIFQLQILGTYMHIYEYDVRRQSRQIQQLQSEFAKVPGAGRPLEAAEGIARRIVIIASDHSCQRVSKQAFMQHIQL